MHSSGQKKRYASSVFELAKRLGLVRKDGTISKDNMKILEKQFKEQMLNCNKE